MNRKAVLLLQRMNKWTS